MTANLSKRQFAQLEQRRSDEDIKLLIALIRRDGGIWLGDEDVLNQDITRVP